MARMNDYEWDFVKDSIDKKVTARSAHHTRTHNGKGGAVKFPSDYMTKKEIKAMSGECIKYASLKKPMTWDEFKALPNDLKKEYITYIRKQFGAPDSYIAEMLGVSAGRLGLYIKDIGCAKGMGTASKKWNKEAFYAWRSGADESAEVKPVVEEPVEELSCESPYDANENANESVISTDKFKEHFCDFTDRFSFEKTNAIPHDGKLSFNCPLDQALNTLMLLLGNNKVELSVQWHVVKED